MASIDWTVLGLGAVIGLGCRKQLKAAGRVAAQTAASIAGVAAQTAASVAKETEKSAEAAAAEQKLKEIDEKMKQMFQDLYGQNGH